jgi:hypothetical protein
MASITQHHTDASESASSASFGLTARLLLASLAIAAGAIHLAMSPIHASSSTTEAVGFAVVGWAQIVLGIGLLLRPSREVLFLTIFLNAGVIGAYIISRTVGLPVGAHAGEAESVQAVDLMVTIFEAALVAGAGLLLVRPDLASLEEGASSLSFEKIAVASAIPLLVLVATSVALADPDLAQHGHDDGGALVSSSGGHGHGGDGGGGASAAVLASLAEDRCDLAVNPAAYWRETTLAGVDTLMGGDADVTDHNAASYIKGTPELDKIIALHSVVEGEVGDAQMVSALAEVDDDVYDNWLRWVGVSGMNDHGHEEGSDAAPDDTGMGGHLGPQPWHAMTDQSQCDALQAELAIARDTAMKYPTVKDAKAAGWRQITPYVPGIAAHFMNFGLVDGKFEIDKPEMILYDGTGDDARVVGLSYYIRQDGDAEPTQGFTGNNDHYHRHIGLCVNASGVIGDSTTTEEECAAMGGRKANGGNGWMSHAWVVPGCESPWGVFSGATPILDPGLFEDNGASGAGCAGSGVYDRFNLDPGEPKNVPTAVGGDVELAVGN